MPLSLVASCYILLLVLRPGATSSVLAPSSDALVTSSIRNLIELASKLLAMASNLIAMARQDDEERTAMDACPSSQMTYHTDATAATAENDMDRKKEAPLFLAKRAGGARTPTWCPTKGPAWRCQCGGAWRSAFMVGLFE